MLRDSFWTFIGKIWNFLAVFVNILDSILSILTIYNLVVLSSWYENLKKKKIRKTSRHSFQRITFGENILNRIPESHKRSSKVNLCLCSNPVSNYVVNFLFYFVMYLQKFLSFQNPVFKRIETTSMKFKLDWNVRLYCNILEKKISNA